MPSDVVSRESYGAAVERLNSFAAGADAERVAAVGDDVLSVARLLAREPRLRRALVDPARPAEARVDLLRTLLDGKVADEALDLVALLVGGRWGPPTELLNATERLGVEALLASAERAGELNNLEDELFRFGQIVSGDRELAATVGDSTADEERRATLVRDLLDGKAGPVTVRLAVLAVAGFGGRGFEASLGRLVELAAARRDRTVAYVITAMPPTDDEEQRLAATLARMYGRQISLKIEVNPAVIGGASVRVGSDLYDGTVLRRLVEARQALSR